MEAGGMIVAGGGGAAVGEREEGRNALKGLSGEAEEEDGLRVETMGGGGG